MKSKKLDKSRLLGAILEELSKRIKESEAQLAEILRRANEAPGAMESHSDTDKNQWGRQAAGQRQTIEAMKLERTAMEALPLIRTGPVEVGSLIEVRDEKDTHRYFLLPGGGGIKIREGAWEVVAVSPTTPLGTALLGKKAGEVAHVANRTLTVLEIY